MCEKKRIGKDFALWLVLLAAGVLLFFVIGERGYALGNDSMGYIAASYEREPLYPLFLMLFRSIFGGEIYLYAVAAAQSAAALGAVLYTAWHFRKIFSLNRAEWAVGALLLMLPFCLDTMWSEPRVNFTHYILTDALSYLLFYLFTVRLLYFLHTSALRHLIGMAVLTMLMVLNRSQMQVCYPVIFLAAFIVYVKHKKPRKLIGGEYIAILILTVALTGGLSYVYSYAMWGEFARSSENDFSMLANLLYAADAEDGELFEGEKAEAFRDLYEQVDAQGYNYKYAKGPFLGNGMHMLECHDPIKYDIIRPYFREYIEGKGMEESFAGDHVKKELASALKEGLMKKRLFRWLYDGICMMPYGLMLAVTPVVVPGYEPLCYCYAAIVWLLAVVLLIRMIFGKTGGRADALPAQKKTCGRIAACSDDPKYDSLGVCSGFAACILAFMLINAASCSMIIMVISRYLNYTQGLFYIVLYLLIRNTAARRKKRSGDGVMR